MNNNKRILPILLSVLTAAIIILSCSYFMRGDLNHDMAYLDDNWNVVINGESYDNITLSKMNDLLSDPLNRGDKITITSTLPDIGYLPFPVILFKTKYTTLDCYIDDKLIYSYGDQEFSDRVFLGKLYHIISLPRNYQSQNITFKMTVSEYNAFTALDPPALGDQPDVEGSLLNSNIMVIATSIFIFIFGIILLFVSLIFASSIPNIVTQILEALFCMNTGAWLLSYFNLLTLFYYTPLETQIEFFTLYLIVPYCYLIVISIDGVEKSRIFYGAFIAQTTVSIVAYISHYFFSLHMRAFLPVYQLLGIFSFCLLGYYAIKTFKRNAIASSEKVQLAGLCFFALSLIIQLVFYILDKLHIQKLLLLNKSIISLGCLVFTLCLLLNYLLYITQTYASRKENASLSHLAYADGLTDMPNRALADKLLDELNDTDTDYCIISIDLNGLKNVNDNFGHPTGDKYIKDFAKVMSNTFEEGDFCGRIGGDEFIAIIKDSSGRDISALISRMNSALNVLNAIYSEYHRSVATGFAFRHEFELNNSHEVYLLADQRMYENKKLMHEKLGISARL